VLLNGANASGKSSFLEIILMAIFGEPIPSRTSPTTGTIKAVADAIINQARTSKNEPAKTDLVLSINDRRFRIVRIFVGSQHKNVPVAKTAELIDLESGHIIARGPPLIKPWLQENIGSIESYLLTVMHTQHDDRNFFTLSSADQTTVLDRLFHMRPCQLFQVFN
jgi:DNA repair exonuclease SbcCD ATPase subunit